MDREELYKFYNELKSELESNTDGFFMIKPSKNKEKLDSDFQKFNAQNDDQKRKSDIRSFALYGMNNYDHYHILLSKIKKGTRDDEIDGLEYNPHDGIVKEEASEYYFSNTADGLEFEHNIEYAKDFNMHTTGRVIIYPTRDQNELESLYMKYMALDTNSRASSDNKARKLFNADNRQIYNYCKEKLIKSKNDETEGNHKVEDETIDKQEEKETSLYSNDLPILSPTDFQTKVEENYKCFSKEDGEKIKVWREAYSLLGHGIKIPEYNKYNLDRINILRKAIYENNDEAIVQCGWIPEIEFNSENRVKASKLVRDKMDAMTYSIKAYNDYIEESSDKSYLDKNHKQNGQKRLSDFKFSKTKNNDDGESYNLFWKDDNDKVVGKVTVDTIPASDGYRWFGSLEVSNKYRGYGLGKQILDIAVNKYKAGALAVYKDNEIAYKMYKKYGFKESSDRKSKDYYYMYLERNKDKSIKESKIVKPEKCTKCGSTNIGVFIQGEPIFKCKDCGEYLGTVPVSMNESNTTNTNKKAVSIVLISGNSWLGKTIKKVQGNEFSHVSISLDDDISRIYSFNRRNGFNGLSYESMKQYTKEGVDKVGVYTFLVTNSVYKQLEKTLDNFNLFINKTKYSILNLLTIPLNIPLDMDMKLVCSEFVDKLLKSASLDLTNKKSMFVSPKDFSNKVKNDTKIVEVFKGNPKDFNPSLIKKKIEKLKRSKLAVYEFVEYDDNIITETKINSKIDSNHSNLNRLNLSSFKKLKIEETLSKKYTILKHVRINKNTNGYIYLDKNDNVVAILNTEKKDDGIWIQALEISKEYQNHGLSKQLLNTAIKDFKVTKLSVNKNNQVAYNIYKSTGFKKESETEKMIMMVLESTTYIEEAKSFPIQFDKDGNLLLKNIKRIDFEQEYTNSHRLLMEYDKQESYDPMKFELAKMQFFITLLEKKIYKQGKDKSVKELKVRARFLNDFKKYLKIVVSNDNTFNFTQYYEQSPFNDAIIQINKNTLKFGWEALKYLIK